MRKPLTIVRAYANYKRDLLIADTEIREDIKHSIIAHINSMENDFEFNYISLDEAMDGIANAEDLICNH